MSRLATIEQIKGALIDRAGTLVPELLPLGKRRGRDWQEAATAQGGLGDSFMVCVHGPKAGVWAHHAAGKKGDILALVGYLKTGDDVGEAVKWARDWLGWGAGTTPRQDANQARVAAERAAMRQAEAEAEGEQRRRRARALWLEGERRLSGTPVETYLEGRGIDLDRLAAHSGGVQPSALRHHPRLQYPWEIDGKRGWTFPALVAAVTAPAQSPSDPGRFLAIHQIFLSERDGRVGKAAVEEPKLSYASIRGGAVFVWRGQHLNRRTGELDYGLKLAELIRRGAADEDEQTLVVTEGIEDALTIAQASPRRRVWAGISVGSLASLQIPSVLSRIVFAVDNDPEVLIRPDGETIRHPARVARDAAIAAWQRQGKRVFIAAPPAGVKDMNELHRQHRGAES